MADRKFLVEYLEKYFDELTPKEFYRAIFEEGELAGHEERQTKGKYNGVAVELLPQEDETKSNARRYILTNELDILDKLLEKENFIIVSPISYIGKSRQAAAARFIYAMAIDLDGMTREQNIIDLFYQIENEVLPKPTYIVWSGTGLHLYYQFEKPIPCFKNITKQLADLKTGLTKNIWNKYITSLADKPQLQSLFQGFRIVGGITKGGNRTRAFEIGEKVTIEYLNEFVQERYKVKDIAYKSNLTRAAAKEKFPEWYERRIVQEQPKGTWVCKKDLYNWWKRRIMEEAKTGHRYYCCMVLAIYAKKCGIDRAELEADAFSLIEPMELLTTEDNNHFTREDVFAALELYNDSYITFPIDSIVQLTNIPIEKNKRNGRRQADHIKLMNFVRDEINKNYDWRNKDGRPTKEAAIREWQEQNPNGTKTQCIKETGISKPTVYKYWSDKE